MQRIFFILGSLSGGMAVASGAFATHTLAGRLDAGALATFETGARYQMYHALALLLVALAISHWPEARLLTVAGWLFIAGTILFSGSLYLLVLADLRWLGAVAPLGGAAFIAGWLLLAWSAWREA